ncbi:rod shape-determining protein MreC [Clostridium sp. 'deep sea']|uniref:rod shape-determining protein MreC n=1 Tax=Clostridium sp. 'deep sea' TaxID=2779445 RepID=UPI0018968867|nr:rod shape-determining protein MreC [Clostridium sp. 'deep sea']QOR36341.1 rod shape-determining protein MreC [Clostridium sp. 'deep sea']
MWEKWKKHITIIISISILLVLMVLTIGSNYHRGIASVADRAFYPIQVIFKSISNFGTKTMQNIKDFKNVQNQRDELLFEIAQLKKFQSENQELKRENKSLLEALNYKQKNTELTMAFSRVVMRDPSDWYKGVTVDIGSSSGITKGMTVVSIQDKQIGLVGIVEEVYKYTSKVHLLVDPAKNIAAAAHVSNKVLPTKIADKPNPSMVTDEEAVPDVPKEEPILWYQGVIEGSTKNPGMMEMIYLTHEAQIELGSTVVTTGLGGYYIPDIPVGVVKELKKDAYGLLQRAIIKPHIDLGRLQEVIIITNPKPQKVVGQ